MRCVGADDPSCDKLRLGPGGGDPCTVMKNGGWTCDDSWSTKCMGDHPSGAEYNSVTVRDDKTCPDWGCGAGRGARGAVFALSRYFHQAGTFIFAKPVND